MLFTYIASVLFVALILFLIYKVGSVLDFYLFEHGKQKHRKFIRVLILIVYALILLMLILDFIIYLQNSVFLSPTPFFEYVRHP